LPVATLDENPPNAHTTPAQGEATQDNGGERRERRSRDRYGRDRRERGERTDRAPREEGAVQETLFNAAEAEQTPHHAQDSHASHDAPVAAAHATQAAPSATAATVTATRSGMPRIQAFTLPLAEMQAVAQSSGLEWVNSDPARIAAVQAAIAAEPKPVHIPRERPPLVILDEGPLVLVETRKDL
jgi:ribonuclease E